MKLLMKNMGSRSFEIQCERSNTIDELKEKYCAKSQVRSCYDDLHPKVLFLLYSGKLLVNQLVIPSLSKKFSSAGRCDFGEGTMYPQQVYFLNAPGCLINLRFPSEDVHDTCIDFLNRFFDFAQRRFHNELENNENFSGEYIYRLKCGDEVVAERHSFCEGHLFYRHLQDFYPRKDIWSFGIYFKKNRTLSDYNVFNLGTIYALDRRRYVSGTTGTFNFGLPGEFTSREDETGAYVICMESENCRKRLKKVPISKTIQSTVEKKRYKMRNDIEKKSTELLSFDFFDFSFLKTKNLGVIRLHDFEMSNICTDCNSPININTIHFRRCSWKISSIITTDKGYPKRKEIGWNVSNGEKDDAFNIHEFLKHNDVQKLQVQTRFYRGKEGRGSVLFRNLDIKKMEYFNPDLSYCMYCGIFDGSLAKNEECDHYAHKECFEKWGKRCLRCKLESHSGIIGMDVFDEYLEVRIQFLISNHDDFVDENELESLRFSGSNLGFKITKTFFLL